MPRIAISRMDLQIFMKHRRIDWILSHEWRCVTDIILWNNWHLSRCRFRIMISIIGFAHNATHTVARGWARRKAVLYRILWRFVQTDDCSVLYRRWWVACHHRRRGGDLHASREGKFTPRYNICWLFCVGTWFNADGRGKSRNRESHLLAVAEMEFQSKSTLADGW